MQQSFRIASSNYLVPTSHLLLAYLPESLMGLEQTSGQPPCRNCIRPSISGRWLIAAPIAGHRLTGLCGGYDERESAANSTQPRHRAVVIGLEGAQAVG